MDAIAMFLALLLPCAVLGHAIVWTLVRLPIIALALFERGLQKFFPPRLQPFALDRDAYNFFEKTQFAWR